MDSLENMSLLELLEVRERAFSMYERMRLSLV